MPLSIFKHTDNSKSLQNTFKELNFARFRAGCPKYENFNRYYAQQRGARKLVRAKMVILHYFLILFFQPENTIFRHLLVIKKFKSKIRASTLREIPEASNLLVRESQYARKLIRTKINPFKVWLKSKKLNQNDLFGILMAFMKLAIFLTNLYSHTHT